MNCILCEKNRYSLYRITIKNQLVLIISFYVQKFKTLFDCSKNYLFFLLSCSIMLCLNCNFSFNIVRIIKKKIRRCYLACSFFPGLYEYKNMFKYTYNTYFFSFLFFRQNCQVFANPIPTSILSSYI